MNFNIIKQCLNKVHELDKKVDKSDSSNKEIYERLNYIQKDIAANKSAIEAQ